MHCCEGDVYLFVEEKWIFVILLLQLGLVEFNKVGVG